MATSKSWAMGRELFEARMPHHGGIEALWEIKWKLPCTKSIYPFHDGKVEDFEPIFKDLIRRGINDGASSEYTSAFLSTAEALTASGDDAAENGHSDLASKFYLRAACVYRIARFPHIAGFTQPGCPEKWKAWEAQKDVYMRAARTWKSPVIEVVIPHAFAEGRDRTDIHAYVRVPQGASSDAHYPLILLMTGLDGYRTDNTTRLDEFSKRKWASIVVEIPGTADCPADPADPRSPDRLWNSVLAWAAKDVRFDMGRVMVWGLSAGGYYAVRIAHTHRGMLIGVVAQGAGCHYWFDRTWLDKADGHEYPFRLLPALATKYGFGSAEEFRLGAQSKFSLLEQGVLNLPSTRLLLVNGMNDGLMPIEDSMMLFEYGSPKEGRFFQDALHMGYPLANNSIYPWMERVMATMKTSS